MQLKSFAIARAALTALILGASAQATILNEYTDLATWTAATTGQVNQDFNGIGSPYSATSAGVTLSSINYRGFYNESSTVGYDTYLYGTPPAGLTLGTGGYMMGGIAMPSVAGSGVATPDTGLRVDLSSLAAFNALSFDFSAFRNALGSGNMIYSTAGTPINLTLQVYESGSLTDTRTLTVPVGSPGAGFFGFTTTGSISGVRLLISTPTNTELNRVLLDNLSYAQAVASGGGGGGGGEIPEPQTYLLCAAGLISVALIRRKMR